jgi:hypothetical protein
VSYAVNDVANEVPVEVLELTPRWGYAGLAANFARMQILVAWYDGDPDKWIDAIKRGMEDDADLPFLIALKQRMADDPSLLGSMRRIIDEFASRFGSL